MHDSPLRCRGAMACARRAARMRTLTRRSQHAPARFCHLLRHHSALCLARRDAHSTCIRASARRCGLAECACRRALLPQSARAPSRHRQSAAGLRSALRASARTDARALRGRTAHVFAIVPATCLSHTQPPPLPARSKHASPFPPRARLACVAGARAGPPALQPAAQRPQHLSSPLCVVAPPRSRTAAATAARVTHCCASAAAMAAAQRLAAAAAGRAALAALHFVFALWLALQAAQSALRRALRPPERCATPRARCARAPIRCGA
jgi:hypothetical protein